MSGGSISRRTVLKGAAAGAVAMSGLAPGIARASANEKFQVASIGSGGMGWGDINQVAGHPDVAVVAVGSFLKAMVQADKVALLQQVVEIAPLDAKAFLGRRDENTYFRRAC